MGFFIPEARLAFTQLRQAFVKAPIFYYFNLKCYIRIETGMSGYAISRILCQLTLNDLSWWHQVVFFSRKMIPAEIRYKTHDGKFLAIVKAFKIWRYYLEGSKHKILVLTDYNNLRRFMEMKNLSFR